MLKRTFQIAFSGLSAISSLIILLAYVTQARMVQFIFIQPVYWILDTLWKEARAICLFIVACGGIVSLLFLGRNNIKNDQKSANVRFSMRSCLWILGMISGGLVLGLLVFYGHSCCETPVFFLFGFPLSWLRGMALYYHYGSGPIVPYVVQNLSQIQWYVDGISLIVDTLFWGNVGVMISLMKTVLRSVKTQKRPIPLNYNEENGDTVIR